jgi:hypothetical protein
VVIREEALHQAKFEAQSQPGTHRVALPLSRVGRESSGLRQRRFGRVRNFVHVRARGTNQAYDPWEPRGGNKLILSIFVVKGFAFLQILA